MTTTASPLHASVTSARQRTDRAEAIKRAWQTGRRPDAAAALAENPDLAADRAVALDLAYEEFCVREEAGEAPEAAAFCARFPFGASLQKLLALHQFLDDHPDALGGVPATWPGAGEAVGDFLVLRELGRGSFSRVYLAVETTAGERPVALKVSAAGCREADTLGPLSHPHLVPVLSARPVGSWTVVAMPFAGTATLEDVLSAVRPPGEVPRAASALLTAATAGAQPDDPPFPARPAFPVRADAAHEDAVTAVAAGIFSAVAYLHERGIAHRDLKPSNVLLGPGGHPYLLDLNLASRAADPWRLAGTLPYMAPEQLATLAGPGARPPTDARPGDVFACGVVLFELLTGRHPFGAGAAPGTNFDRDRAAAGLLAAQRASRPNPGTLNPRVRRAVRAAVARCLALDPRERPSAAELTELFARAGAPRPRRFAVPLLAGAGLVALGLGYGALRAPDAASQVPRERRPDVAPPAQQVAATAPAAPFERGLQLMRANEPGLASVEFVKAGNANKDGRAYGFAAYCLSAGRGAPEDARDLANEAIRLGYREAPVYANRAYNHLKAGKLDEARRDCDEAVRRDPNLAAARYTRAVVGLQLHYQKGQPLSPDVVTDARRAAEGMPDAPDVWLTAARVYVIASAERPALKDDAARGVRSAVLAGKDVETVKRNTVLKAALAEHPVYQEALSLSPGRSPRPENPHLAALVP